MSTAPEAVARIVGLSLPAATAELLGFPDPPLALRLAEAYREAFLARRARREETDTLFPGVADILTALAARGLLLGIATGKAMRGLRSVPERHGLDGRFVTLQTADLHPSKPHPSTMLAAMAETGTAAHEAVLVGDTSFDMRMARAAGARPVGVAWGNHPAEELHAAGAHRVLERFEELSDLLDGSVPAADGRASGSCGRGCPRTARRRRSPCPEPGRGAPG